MKRVLTALTLAALAIAALMITAQALLPSVPSAHAELEPIGARPRIIRTALTTTETSVALTGTVTMFLVTEQTAANNIRLAFEQGQTADNGRYILINSGGTYSAASLRYPSGVLYLRGDTASCVSIVHTWGN